MKNYYIYLFLLTLFVFGRNPNAIGQNLVPNPSFEDTVFCPTTANQLDKCAYWWPSLESPDYFHECDFITGSTGVPNNFCGFQYPNTGKAYVGFIPFTRTTLNGREYFTCQLLTPLSDGESYDVSFYLNWSAGIGKKIACNKIGVLFTTSNYNLSNPLQIMNFAHIYTDSVESDSINWKYINKKFIADSNYTYLSIGNFYDDVFTDTIALDPSAHAYYYIDDVSVTLDSTTQLINRFPDNIQVFPNPFETSVTIENDYANIVIIEIVNLYGQTMHKQTLDGTNSINLDLRYLTSGIYFLQINDKQKLLKVSKLIKT